ncbi:MAG: DUF4384 domain-containing protein [Candidatus Bipolaricaulota bacterium]
MTRTKRTALVLTILSALALSLVGLSNGAPAPLGITPTPTPSPLSVSIWTDKAQYAVGENVTIFFNVTQAAYIYVYDIQPDGVVRLVFPNAYSASNYRMAGTHSLPDGLYQFTVYPPTGLEQLQIFASPIPLSLAPSTYSEPFPMVGPNPGVAAQGIQAQLLGIVPDPGWATAWASFTIVASYGYTPPSGGSTPYVPPYYYQPYYPPQGYTFMPPFVGFPGGTWYWYEGAWHYGTPASGWYWSFGTDLKWHFHIVIRFGTGG